MTESAFKDIDAAVKKFHKTKRRPYHGTAFISFC